MSVPVPQAEFYPQPFTIGSDGNAIFWPQVPIENEQSVNFSEFPPFKKPRTFEETPPPLNSFQNQGMNQQRMMMMMPLPQTIPQNKGMGKLFFKTRLCAKFKAGECPYGDNCNFAHGVEDIRKPPPNWQEIVASHEEGRATGNWEEDQKLITRFKLCKKYCNGEECPYGDKCNFLHRDVGKCREDSSRVRESSAISIGTTGSIGYNVGAGRPDQPDVNGGVVNSVSDVNWGIKQQHVYFKTRICQKWEQNDCPYGDKCHFAHGVAELYKHGGHNEVETGSTTIDLAKFIPNTNDATTPGSNTAVVSSKNQVVLAKKCLLNWDTKKLSRIYADWIEPRSPTNVES
ncbi:hypothetical protein MKW98_007493 [Papaver atlanticum]|uniref:C3H1-type domain-containing protein n=1 Tax=Papaver atlanticum TaxID=357466 RepID=A0AAD4XBN4_9MAGN|nr:hypothetical protein MKW98_007493 [Papaver atlanticum]